LLFGNFISHCLILLNFHIIFGGFFFIILLKLDLGVNSRHVSYGLGQKIGVAEVKHIFFFNFAGSKIEIILIKEIMEKKIQLWSFFLLLVFLCFGFFFRFFFLFHPFSIWFCFVLYIKYDTHSLYCYFLYSFLICFLSILSLNILFYFIFFQDLVLIFLSFS